MEVAWKKDKRCDAKYTEISSVKHNEYCKDI